MSEKFKKTKSLDMISSTMLEGKVGVYEENTMIREENRTDAFSEDIHVRFVQIESRQI